ncbi:XK-related protein 6-like [Tropilaelaps mercedesae]|uniref:XK-related protein n=1 Tax=Tropilaelaps mercedesae TaxID=418985 RepID=A0A1V9XD32_9ACAR|nr:XK-related protein 6-like [Tropilaelaps mercedesae]
MPRDDTRSYSRVLGPPPVGAANTDDGVDEEASEAESTDPNLGSVAQEDKHEMLPSVTNVPVTNATPLGCRCVVDYYLLMIHEDRDTALLSLFKAVLQSAPQATLQIFLLASEFSHKGHIANELIGGCQLASAVSSLVSIALSLSSYHRALRRSVPDKYNMSRTGATLQFIWRFNPSLAEVIVTLEPSSLAKLCTVGSRIICIALFTSEYTFWLIPLCVGHWGVMSVWVMHQGTRFCDTDSGQPRQCEEYLFDMLIGAIYLVCFLNVKDEPTRSSDPSIFGGTPSSTAAPAGNANLASSTSSSAAESSCFMASAVKELCLPQAHRPVARLRCSECSTAVVSGFRPFQESAQPLNRSLSGGSHQ